MLQKIRSETITTDPITGITKRTVISERISAIEASHKIVRLPPHNPKMVEEALNGHEIKDRLLGPAYQARIIAIDSQELAELEVEQICGELVVTKVKVRINECLRIDLSEA